MPRVYTFHILAQQTKQFPAAALHFTLHVSLLHQENQARLPLSLDLIAMKHKQLCPLPQALTLGPSTMHYLPIKMT